MPKREELQQLCVQVPLWLELMGCDLALSESKSADDRPVSIRKQGAELKEELKRGEVSINAAHAKVVQGLERARKVAELESIASQEAKAIDGVYDVIVIDPPWPMKKVERQDRPMQVGNGLDYPTMSEEGIRLANSSAR